MKKRKLTMFFVVVLALQPIECISSQVLRFNSQVVVVSSYQKIGGSYFVDPSFSILNTVSKLATDSL